MPDVAGFDRLQEPQTSRCSVISLRAILGLSIATFVYAVGGLVVQQREPGGRGSGSGLASPPPATLVGSHIFRFRWALLSPPVPPPPPPPPPTPPPTPPPLLGSPSPPPDASILSSPLPTAASAAVRRSPPSAASDLSRYAYPQLVDDAAADSQALFPFPPPPPPGASVRQPSASGGLAAWRRFGASPSDAARAVVARLSETEKVSLLTGFGWKGHVLRHGCFVGSVSGVPRLGLPSLNMQDALQGFRTSERVQVGSVTAFPSALAAAATWDRSLVRRYAAAIGPSAATFHDGKNPISARPTTYDGGHFLCRPRVPDEGCKHPAGPFPQCAPRPAGREELGIPLR